MEQKLEINKLAAYYWSCWYNFDLNFLCENWDMKLYHFLPYKHFMSLLKNQQLYLVNILKSWGNEPYELCYFRPDYYKNIDNILSPTSVEEMSHRLYGQCWTTNKESDAMWQIYSGKDGVRICTTLGRIIQLLYPYPVSEKGGLIPYVGFQKYQSQVTIKRWIKKNRNPQLDQWHDLIRESLFYKRVNFKHEQEFRIVLEEALVSKEGEITPWEEGRTIPIVNDPNFIQEITLSPFTADSVGSRRIKAIKKLVKNDPDINVSSLYKNDLAKEKIVIEI